MNMEHYAIHIAPRGGKIDQIVDQIAAERAAAFQVRIAYSRTKNAMGLYASESSVTGLLFENEAAVPEGWRVESRREDSAVAVPKSKDKTKVSRELTKKLKAELAALPSLPGAWEFTNRIGGSQVLSDGEPGQRGFALRSCSYERIGDTTFVLTPWSTKSEEDGELDEKKGIKTAFLPEGCERVPLSVYYQAKEAAEVKKEEVVA